MDLEHVEAVATAPRRHRAVAGPQPRARLRRSRCRRGSSCPTSATPSRSRTATRWAAAPAPAADRVAGRSPTTPPTRPPGSVLVTTTLTPGLGPLLSRLNGIVAETGSVLSHLAILAREAGVATVVGYAGAVEDLPEGTVVTVDGDTGRVTVDDGRAAA